MVGFVMFKLELDEIILFVIKCVKGGWRTGVLGMKELPFKR